MTDLAHTPIRLDVDNPVETLAYIPYRLGFKPAASIVFLAVRYSYGAVRLGFAARVDIADALNPSTRDSLWRAILQQVNREHSVQVHIAIYDDTITRGAHDLAGVSVAARHRLQSLRGLLRQWYKHDAFRPSHTYLVGERTWGCLTCDHPTPCPPQGRPVAELDTAVIAAQMVVNGRAIAPSREDLISVPRVPSGKLARAHRGADDELTHYLRAVVNGKRWSWRASMVRKWHRARRESLGTPQANVDDLFAPELLGRLGIGLFDVLVRDAVIYSLCSGADVLHPDSSDLGAGLDELFGPRAPSPDETSKRGLDLLEAVAAYSETDLSVPALASWAWCQWWNGNGAQANLLTAQCLRIDPHYSLATLLDSLLTEHVRPPWAIESS